MSIADDIQAAVVKAELANAQRGGGSRAASNHASQLGFPCLRKLWYDRTSAHLRPAIDERTAFIFKVGRTVEREARRELENAGYTVTLSQGVFTWDAYNITGSVDGFLTVDGETLPIEIKSVSGNYWGELTSIEAMKNSSHFWVRNYPAQLCLYMLMSNHARGLFYLSNKQTGQPRVLLMEIDYEMGERCVQAAIAINEAVELDIPPDRMPFNAKTCGMCPYVQVICGPPQPPRPQVTDSEIVGFLKDFWERKKAASGYDKAKKQLAVYFPTEAVFMADEFEVTVTKNKKGTLMRRVRNLLETKEEE